MKENYTHASILIDRSGSMKSIKSEVISGFNELVGEQKSEEGELTITLVQFDSNWGELRYNVSNDFSPIGNVTLLSDDNYRPKGSTPLNDALTRLINETGQKLASMNEEDRPSKVLIVCITDGAENTSTLYTKQSLKQLIAHQESKYNWKFIYMGANQDSFSEGLSRGVKTAYNFEYSGSGAKKMSKVFSRTLSAYRSYSPSISTTEFDLSSVLQEASNQVDLEDIK
jgi:hypothetical protein